MLTYATPTSSPHRPYRPNQQHMRSGFTLIEVLIVVLLISIIMSTVVGAFTGVDQTQSMQGYVERMAQRIEMARDRAVQTNHEWGIYVEDEHLYFAEFDDISGEWIAREQRPFKLDNIASTVRFSAKVEAYDGLVGADEDKLPSLILFSSGETSPFELSLEFTDFNSAPWVLHTDGFQRTQIRKDTRL